WSTTLHLISLFFHLCLCSPAELDSQEISDATKSSTPYPLFLPVTYQVWDADYFLLKEAGQDIMRNSSMQSHTQPFVVLRAGRLPVINASYGPLSTKREIPLDLVQSEQLFQPSPPVFTLSWKVQSFVLTRWVYSSSPKVRVLFYVAGRDWDRGEKDKEMKDELPCVTVYAFWQTQEVRGSCVIGNEHGTCMAEVDPPEGWFSPVEGSSSRERQGPTQGNPVELYYQARPSAYGPCTASGEEGKRWDMGDENAGQPQAEYIPVTPIRRIGSVRLLQVKQGAMPVSVLRLREAVVIQTSSKPLKKTDIASFYVYVRSSANLDTFSLRLSKLQAVLQMDFEVEDVSNQSEIQVIKWELTLPDEIKMMGASEGTMRIYTTQRDFVGLAPLVVDTELLNTAVLTGKRVTVGVRTIAVEQDGSVMDVSEFADCSSTDEDVLKVSDRCNFVYVNGKETQGRLRMLVNFTYSYLSAQLEMQVWFPRLPLDIEVSDTELSQIKSWRIPIMSTKSKPGWSSEEERKGRGCMLQFQHALVRVLTHFVAEQSGPREPQAFFLGSDWQVDVTRLVQYFLKVEDTNIAHLQAGRILSGQDVGTTSIKVLSPLSDSILAEKMVRVVDDRVTITELGLQLVSGLTLSLQLSTGSNRVISTTATTQEVLSNPKQRKSTLAVGTGSLTVKFQTNSKRPDNSSTNNNDTGNSTGLLAGVAGKDNSSKRGDEGEEADSEKKLQQPEQVSSRNSESEREESALKITTTAKSTARDSTVGSIANNLGMGRANDASDGVSKPGNILNSGNFFSTGKAGNDGRTGISWSSNEVPEGSVLSTGKASGNLVNYNNYPPQVEIPKQKPKNDYRDDDDDDDDIEGPLPNRPLTDLEIGMYALLGVFCLAIIVFMVNCVSYLVKFRHKQTPGQVSEQTGHRHDWVWLGTDAELVMNVTGSPLQQDAHNTSVIDIGPNTEPCGTLNRRTSCQVSSVSNDSNVLCVGSPTAKPVRSESLHSPTSKRKRVQFTTFTSLDRQTPPKMLQQENGHGINWVGKEDSCMTPVVPAAESLQQL
uniref:Transmembrane protein 132C-like n=1 Tax=Sinocyclocheilus rhinocerous TaxID=307959 RepID=A0A673MR24_9TELE